MILNLFVFVILTRFRNELALSGGNFHLKVGGGQSSGNAGDPMQGVAVSGGSRIYKRGGHKIMDAYCLYDHTFII